MLSRFIFTILTLASCSSNTPKETEVESTSTVPVIVQPTADSVAKKEETPSGPLVYVTNEGDNYHTADCRYSKEAHTVTLKQAKSDGKKACDLCKPNSVTGDKQIRCSVKTTDGSQCKRMTTSASGKCFQHGKP